MAREKAYFREVLADIVEVTGKRLLGVYDVKRYLKVGYNKAAEYMGGEKHISAHQLASKLL